MTKRGDEMKKRSNFSGLGILRMTKKRDEMKKRSTSKKESQNWSSSFPGLDILRMTKRRQKGQDLRDLYLNYNKKEVANNGGILRRERSINNLRMKKMALTGPHD